MMVFDEWLNGIPVAYIISARNKTTDLSPWMKRLRDRLLQSKPDWRPNAFVVDDADAEINAIRYTARSYNVLSHTTSCMHEGFHGSGYTAASYTENHSKS